MRLDAGNENVTDDAFYRKADLHIAGHAKAIYNLANHRSGHPAKDSFAPSS